MFSTQSHTSISGGRCFRRGRMFWLVCSTRLYASCYQQTARLSQKYMQGLSLRTSVCLMRVHCNPKLVFVIVLDDKCVFDISFSRTLLATKQPHVGWMLGFVFLGWICDSFVCYLHLDQVCIENNLTLVISCASFSQENTMFQLTVLKHQVTNMWMCLVFHNSHYSTLKRLVLH